MKRIKVFLTFLFSAVVLFAQNPREPYLWPIDGAEAGANIISAPQSFIDGELNFGNLFIGAAEGTVVLSPVDGTITFVSVGYMQSLISSVGCSRCDGECYDEKIQNNKQKFDVPGGANFFHGYLGIKSKDGKQIWIRGLSGSEDLKTGQAVKRGTPIGKVAYSYFKIEQPSIKLSIDEGNRTSDPMTPFGIKSSYIPPQKIDPILSLTKKQAKEDFMIYINVLKEAYPGLYNVVTKEELDEYVRQTIASIESNRGNLEFERFMEIIKGAIAKIHDSHIYFLGLPWKTENKPSPLKRSLDFGWINDTLVCTNAVAEYDYLINKPIKSVNGMNTDSIKQKVISNTAVYDAKVESYKNFHLAFASNFCNGLDTDLNVEFTDGASMHLEGVDQATKLSYNLNQFNKINKYTDGYRVKMLDNSTAYIGLSTFSLNQIQVEKIGAFIKSISGVPNLIIDVRNNGGGDGDVVEKLYSYIAGDTLVTDSYSKVNSRSGYESFKYSLNRTIDDDSFTGFLAEEGKDGFYQRPEKAKTIVPDPDINYKGNVYVLINDLSASAAALFPAMLVRNHRGVVVGRETRTAFHFMNAAEFADIRLPNSKIAIKVPLLQYVFDDIVNDRTPFGRGVLPDYSVPITINELSFKSGDAILKYTLELIENKIYFEEELSHSEIKCFNISSLWKVIVAVLPVLTYLLYRYRTRGNKKQL